MRTNYFILIVLLFSFSFVNAQTNTVDADADKLVVVSKEVKEKAQVSDSSNLSEKIEDSLIIDINAAKEEIAKSTSDIRTYFNRLRNVDNIKLIFPKINKARKA
ncbi:hypothetical protein [Snuella sedimenti]|uniref:Uncharacterized protein n=1 Tax=Snuella sedimenti TaxID=2798802 RepID=A0A8J7IZW8_9FLAO|nr:hypothetical protein [Snuella sedimenti]MBJ6369740.1 hypothetical protein [Snuella sedimenti]